MATLPDPTVGTGAEAPFDLARPQSSAADAAVNYVDPETGVAASTDESAAEGFVEDDPTSDWWGSGSHPLNLLSHSADVFDEPDDFLGGGVHAPETADELSEEFVAEADAKVEADWNRDSLVCAVLQQVALMRSELAHLGEHLGAFPPQYAVSVQQSTAWIFGGEG